LLWGIVIFGGVFFKKSGARDREEDGNFRPPTFLFICPALPGK
jgi:hypothetical protein